MCMRAEQTCLCVCRDVSRPHCVQCCVMQSCWWRTFSMFVLKDPNSTNGAFSPFSFTWLHSSYMLSLMCNLCTDLWTALKQRTIPPRHRSLSSAPACHLPRRPHRTQVAHLQPHTLEYFFRTVHFIRRPNPSACVLPVGIREHSEIKQSVSKLTEEVSADLTLMIIACVHFCPGGLMFSSAAEVWFFC